MQGEKLKEYLLRIAEQINEKIRLEDIYQQLALVADIELSELDELKGDVINHETVVLKSKEWLNNLDKACFRAV